MLGGESIVLQRGHCLHNNTLSDSCSRDGNKFFASPFALESQVKFYGFLGQRREEPLTFSLELSCFRNAATFAAVMGSAGMHW